MSEKKTITAHTKLLCLIGHPVEHSMSPTMWNPALQELGLDYIYLAFNVHPDHLEGAVEGLRSLDIKGINVTIPYKEIIMKYLDEIDEVAQRIGAINTIKNEDGFLKARNTDAAGGKKSILDAGCDLSGKKVLFLGSGGVARALCYELAQDINKIILTDIIEERSVKLANEIKKQMDVDITGLKSSEKVLKKEIKDTDILINATPIGMYPKVNETPFKKEFLHNELFIFDVVYNPLETRLMREAAEIGCQTLSGLDMLVNQGVLAFEWWIGKSPNSTLMKNKIINFLGIK